MTNLDDSKSRALLALSGMKRVNSMAAGPDAKRWKPTDSPTRRAVSFGHLNETVLYDKHDSSSNLSQGVSVSEMSFGSAATPRSTGNFRWETTHQSSPSSNGNATWGAPPAPRDSRWKPTSRPNMFMSSLSSQQGNAQSSATSNALRLLSAHQSSHKSPSSPNIFPSNNGMHHQLKFPTRCPSPTPGGCDVLPSVPLHSFEAPPRRPGRCASPITFTADSTTTMQQQPGPVNAFQLGMAPIRPVRRASLVTGNL